MNKDLEGIEYLIHKFPCIRDVEIKESIFVETQIKRLFQDPTLKNTLNADKKVEQDACENVYRKLFEKQKISKLWRNCRESTLLFKTLGL